MTIQRTAEQIKHQNWFDDSLNDDLDMLKDRVDADVIDALKDSLALRSRLLVKHSIEDQVFGQVMRRAG